MVHYRMIPIIVLLLSIVMAESLRIANVCKLPKKTGLCKARIPRWYYNRFANRCLRFIYGGCGSNGNNFRSKMACEQRCVRPAGDIDVCNRPKKTGLCRARFFRWYYNRFANRCLKFIYGGCGSNGNNFRTKKACERRCLRKPPAGDICKLKKETGPCRAYFIRYFYNAESKKCERFVYGGCLGNDNRFRTMSACKKRCAK